MRTRSVVAVVSCLELGREYAAAYVELVHYAERLLRDAQTAAVEEPGSHRGGPPPPDHR